MTSFLFHHYAIVTGRATAAPMRAAVVASLDVRWKDLLARAVGIRLSDRVHQRGRIGRAEPGLAPHRAADARGKVSRESGLGEAGRRLPRGPSPIGSARAVRKVRYRPGRLLAILRFEGLRGVVDRLRYPKPVWRRSDPLRPIAGPVLIVGGDAGEREEVRAALARFGIGVAASSAESHAEIVCVNRIPERDPAGRRCAVAILRAHVRATPEAIAALAKDGTSVIVESAATLRELRRQGVARVFSLKAPGRIGESLCRYLVASQANRSPAPDWPLFSDLRDLPATPRICLSLPETTERRDSFLSAGQPGFRSSTASGARKGG